MRVHNLPLFFLLQLGKPHLPWEIQLTHDYPFRFSLCILLVNSPRSGIAPQHARLPLSNHPLLSPAWYCRCVLCHCSHQNVRLWRWRGSFPSSFSRQFMAQWFSRLRRIRSAFTKFSGRCHVATRVWKDEDDYTVFSSNNYLVTDIFLVRDSSFVL